LGVTKDQFDVIDLSDNNIRKLDNLPKLKRLETLLMHNNRVEYISKEIGEQLTKMNTLVLTNNNLAELGDIDALATLPRLEYLRFTSFITENLIAICVLVFKAIH
jgi:U2 small nuclear ribonucleoprotein A'